MRKKLGLPSSIAVLIVILTLIFPHVSSAGVREYIVSNTTGSINYNTSFSHNGNNIAQCTDRPAIFTNNMRVSLGAVTNSSIRVNSHTITPSISSGVVKGGNAISFSTSGTSLSNGTYFNTTLTSGTPYLVSWNRTLPISSTVKSAVVQQFLFPSNYGGSDYCVVRDDMVFTHGSLLYNSNNNELLSSTISINSSKVQKLEANIKLLGLDKIAEISNDTGYTKAFSLDDNLLDLSIYNTPVEILDVLDSKNYGNIKVYTAQNIEGVNVYTLEIRDNDQYIYLTSTIELEDLLTLIV